MNTINQAHNVETSGDAPSIDLSFVEQMCRGNQEQIKKMIDVFSKQVAVSIKIMKEASANNQPEVIAREAHKIRPAVNTFGLQKISEDLSFIEDCAKNEEPVSSYEKKLSESINQLQLLINKLS